MASPLLFILQSRSSTDALFFKTLSTSSPFKPSCSTVSAVYRLVQVKAVPSHLTAMVKILMVHGFGVNAAIFEAQTGTFKSKSRL